MTERLVSLRGMGQLDGMVLWMSGLDDIAKKPVVMVPLVHSFGRGISRNFNSEITPLGRSWQPLSPFTQKTRKARGYPPSRPILEQSGQLRELASTAFLKWGNNTRSSNRNVVAPYGNFEPLSMKASINDGAFKARLSGSRVQNQYGKRLSWGKPVMGSRDRVRVSTLPSRPFWGVTQSMIDEGLPITMLVLMREWRDSARGFWAR